MKGGKEKEIDIFHGTHMLHFCSMNMAMEFPGQMIIEIHCNPVQGRNRVFPVNFFSQGKTCFHYRGTLFSLQGPCFHYRDFPVRKSSQGKPCFHYREWVCSVFPDSLFNWHVKSSK